MPYHRGYLLYGPPGTGKTSLASAIAYGFGMSIYSINLNEFNDRTLVTALNEVPPKSMILFEDIDCMRGGKARGAEGEPPERIASALSSDGEGVADKMGVTLSGLLNALDGFSAPEDVLFVMTSNKIESLDPTLLRPGRIDYRLFMGEASEGQKIEHYRRFFPSATEQEATAFVQSHAARTMAEFQGLLLALEGETTATGQVQPEPKDTVGYRYRIRI